MFDIEQALAGWRARMKNRGIINCETLAELENHLREEFSRQIKVELEPDAAFGAALVQLGTDRQLEMEFRKIRPWNSRSVSAGLALLGGSAILLALPILHRSVSWILGIHIVSLTVGYEAVFLAGSFSGAWVFWPQSFLVESCRFFFKLGAALILTAVVLGSFLSEPATNIATLQRHGAISVLIWMSIALAFQKMRKTSLRVDGLLALVVTMRVTMAWFCPYATAYPMAPWVWLLAVVLGANVLLMLIALLRKEQVTT